MFTISVSSNIKEFTKQIRDVPKKQVEFAARLALNITTRAAVQDFAKAMPVIFDRPVPFTVNAAYAIPVTSAENAHAAAVAIRFSAGKGTPAEKYLKAEILGGARAPKRFERRLSWSAAVSGIQFILPGRGIAPDAYGNIPASVIGNVLRQLRAFTDTGQNISKAKLRRLERQKLLTNTVVGRSKFFVAKSRSTGQPIGIWNVLGHGHVQPIMLFSKKPPTYAPRFDFHGLMAGSFAKHWPAAFREALAKAIATAR